MNYVFGPEREHWWNEAELVFDYDLSGIHQSVLDRKDEKSDEKILADSAYDFVVFIGAYPW
jgi:hypothetical protein